MGTSIDLMSADDLDIGAAEHLVKVLEEVEVHFGKYVDDQGPLSTACREASDYLVALADTLEGKSSTNEMKRYSASQVSIDPDFSDVEAK